MSEKREQWLRAKAVFQDALRHEAANRRAFVAMACAEDASLAARVYALLEADAQTNTPLEAPVVTLAGRLLREPATGTLDRQFDRYRLLKEIGRGGMGAVYLAQRDDGAYEADVAIKVMQGGMLHPSFARRFHQERQILARLDHPNIARLLDGGVTDDGHPYLVMEHVEGLPFDQYCDDRQLDIAQRIDLFRVVCQAVHAAHRNLVVHCDLKPSNILITDAGVPKLLDFGIARMLDPEHEERPAAATAGGGFMTPEYASPEQVRGEGLTTASDVYGLGVVLYRLLTGKSPYRVEDPTRHLLEQATLNERPQAPSQAVQQTDPSRETLSGRRATTPARLGRHLRGDLDTIVLKALEKDPARRYPSAQDLAEDLARHRTGRAVTARPHTVRYRAAKYLQRNWLGVTAVALIALSMAIGTATTVHQARVARQRAFEADQQSEVARQRERDAQQTLRFVVELFESTHPDNASQRTLLDVLNDAEGTIERGFADQPIAGARLMDTLGEVYRQLEQLDRAELLLERSLAIRTERLAPDHLEVADSRDELGALRIAQNRLDDAGQQIREAHAIRMRHLGPNHLDVALSDHRLGQLALKKRDLEIARGHFERALDIRRHQLGKHPKVAEALNNLGVTLAYLEQFETAEAAYDEALTLRVALLGDDHWRTANTRNNLGGLFRRLGRNVEAVDMYTEALAVMRPTLGAHTKVAAILSNLAVALEELGQLDAALGHLEEARGMMVATRQTESRGYGIIVSSLRRVQRARSGVP